MKKSHVNYSHSFSSLKTQMHIMYLYIHVSQITCIQNESKLKVYNKSLFTYNIN